MSNYSIGTIVRYQASEGEWVVGIIAATVGSAGTVVYESSGITDPTDESHVHMLFLPPNGGSSQIYQNITEGYSVGQFLVV